MSLDQATRTFAYRRSADQDRDEPVRHRVVVVGAGPVGLTCALDLARKGIEVVLVDDDDTLSTGSRAICFAKRTLEIWDRLGCGQRMVDKGVSWNVGKVFFRDDLVYRFDLLAEEGHRRPAFINLQQYHVEGFLCDAVARDPRIDLRWKSRVAGIERTDEGALLTIGTPDGPYRLHADWVVACDGARSPVRGMLGLSSEGHSFRDRFLIVDVKMAPETSKRFTAERWFWFDPPFHRGQSVLLHRQPDDVWRIDFQLGWNADPVVEREPGRVEERVRALLGADARFTVEWLSIYTFACLRMARFRHGRVLFVGDAAHGVSPFGARGANSGVQDADNLAWKLALVVQGRAPGSLLDTYDEERVAAADENILNSTRSTDFITPKSDVSRAFRDAVLALAADHPFARRLVNSGRLSVPATLASSSLNTADRDAFDGLMCPGAPCADAPTTIDRKAGWLLEAFGDAWTLLCFDAVDAIVIEHARARELRVVVVARDASHSRTGTTVAVDVEGLVAARYDGAPGTVYLVRPDQHVCARWRRATVSDLDLALARATCNATVGS